MSSNTASGNTVTETKFGAVEPDSENGPEAADIEKRSKSGGIQINSVGSNESLSEQEKKFTNAALI